MTSIDEQNQQLLDAIRVEIDDPDVVELCEDAVGFASEHQVLLDAQPINLWGFGKGMQLFRQPEGGWWMSLESITEATGVPYSRLLELFEEEHEERGATSTGFMTTRSGTSWRLVTHDFVMRVFALHSPWHAEFYENTKDLMSHAMEKSGLMDQLAGSGTGFSATVSMVTTDGKLVQVLLPVEGFDAVDDVPLVRSPWDDAPAGEVVRASDLGSSWELHRSGDAARAVLGTDAPEDEAVRRAMRGPHVEGGAE